jgi:hypothetical protein
MPPASALLNRRFAPPISNFEGIEEEVRKMAPEEFEQGQSGTPATVYVRPIAAADVFEQVQPGNAIEIDGVTLEPDQQLYAIHDEDGRRVGLFADRDAAFAAARWHGAAPVSVH